MTMQTQNLKLGESLPDDLDAVMVGRVWDPETGGPRVVHVRDGRAVDITHWARSLADLLDADDPVDVAVSAPDGRSWELDELAPAANGRPERTSVLSPIDLQVIKACGVTFAKSMVERVIEEAAGGDATQAAEVRRAINAALGTRIDSIVPGSPEAERLRVALVGEGIWSQYLEVGIGPDPEVFTKSPVLSSVGWGATVGVAEASRWSNPEPELVLVANARGRVRGATLGNDVNLRDIEGRSSLLLGKAKDNNASAALGPFIRLFDGDFDLVTLAGTTLQLRIEGQDGLLLEENKDLSAMSRSFGQLIAAVHGRHHQYPDGFALFTGTPFAPVQDRGAAGMGFTHHEGDLVTIRSSDLGTLCNTTGISEELPPWDYGIRDLARYWEGLSLSARRAPL